MMTLTQRELQKLQLEKAKQKMSFRFILEKVLI